MKAHSNLGNLSRVRTLSRLYRGLLGQCDSNLFSQLRIDMGESLIGEGMSNVVLPLQAVVKADAIESFLNDSMATASEGIKELHYVSINLCQNPDQTNQFTLYETWANNEYLLSDAHRKSPRILAFFKNTQNMLFQPFQYSILDSLHELKAADFVRR